MIDLEPIIAAAQEALKARHLSELEEFGERGTDALNQFGWTRLTRLLIRLLPFTAKANPQAVLEMAAELKALRATIADLKAGSVVAGLTGSTIHSSPPSYVPTFSTKP